MKRDICAVITKGTITDGDMLVSAPDAAYLMTIYEVLNKESLHAASTTIGLCFLDAATSRFIIGQVILSGIIIQLLFLQYLSTVGLLSIVSYVLCFSL